MAQTTLKKRSIDPLEAVSHLMTVAAAAEYLGWKYYDVYRMTYRKELDSKLVGSVLLVRRADVEALKEVA
jgi:excisionase family DNA binding protein